MEMYKFIEESKDRHLTIADVKNLDVGEEIDCVIWDRNFEEYWIWNKTVSEKPYKATEFFKHNRVKVKYLGNMKWLLKMSWGEFEHSVHINTCKSHFWPVDDDQMIRLNKIMIDVKTLPTKTRVGWRGPMMLWKHLESMPKVYNKSGYYGSETEK